MHKSTPLELLATKTLALFEIDPSHPAQAVGEMDEAQLTQKSVLAIIDKRMQAITEHYVHRMALSFDPD